MLEPARQDEMAIEPLRARRYLGERHSHLESDASFLRQDAHRAMARIAATIVSNNARISGGLFSKWCSRSVRPQACVWLRLAKSRPHF
jgi:hypothetical protein